jgi:hypothetical protein
MQPETALELRRLRAAKEALVRVGGYQHLVDLYDDKITALLHPPPPDDAQWDTEDDE